MPQPDYEPDIELNRFLLSKEWQAILDILEEARSDWIGICTDKDSPIDRIRYAQGAYDMIETFKDLPAKIFKGEVDNGKYNK